MTSCLAGGGIPAHQHRQPQLVLPPAANDEIREVKCCLSEVSCQQSCTAQVVAFRAFLRTNTGNHNVVSPYSAPWYFGSAPAGSKGPR